MATGLTTFRTLVQRCQSSCPNFLNSNDQNSPSSLSKFYKEHCIYLPAMLGWFFFSALLSLYNKYIFGSTHLAFPCPLLMTSIHFLSQWCFAYTASSLFPIKLGGDQVSEMPWKLFLNIAIPCGFVTSADVGFSNLALVRISVTFYTMVKASSPIFVVLSAYIFGIEQITTPLIIVVLIISMGELLTVLGEVEFDMIGFILCFIASVLSGMRWTVVQLKIQSIEPKLKSTIATMRILSPFMFLSMLIMSLVKEQPWYTMGEWINTFDKAMLTVGLSFLGATLAICMMLCEFYLIMKSNAIILMIGGVLKELNTIALSVGIFGDKLNAINVLGCVVVFSGVMLYKVSLHVSKLESRYDVLVKESRSRAEEEDGGLDEDDNEMCCDDYSTPLQHPQEYNNNHESSYHHDGQHNKNESNSTSGMKTSTVNKRNNRETFVIDDGDDEHDIIHLENSHSEII